MQRLIPINTADPASLAAKIAAAAKLTLALTALLKTQTRHLDTGQPWTAELAEAKIQLTAERDLAMRGLKDLQGIAQPNREELQALVELAEQDAELTLCTLNYRLAAEPDNIEIRYHRAVIFSGRGGFEPAKADYMAVLTKEPTHPGALIDFGNLLFNNGFCSAAKTLYQQALTLYPGNVQARVNLANLLQSRSDYMAAKTQYQAVLEIQPECAEAHQGLSYALSGLGEEAAAAAHRELGFRNRAVLQWPYRKPRPGLPVLILCSAAGGNIELKTILAAGNFAVTLIFTEYFDPAQPLPAHRLVFNAIGDADLCGKGLEAAQALLSQTRAPVINPPERVKMTGRIDNAAGLAKLPGVRTAKSMLLPRRELLDDSAAADLAERGFRFPLLVRSPGYHTGQFFSRLENAGELPAALQELPGEELLVLEWLDARNRQGDFHKYRVMFVDGKLYPLHMAVSKHWKVHYFSANMDLRADARTLEEEFLHDMQKIIGYHNMHAIGEMCKTLNLDYAGVDFALADNGEILLFEANATMIVPYPDADEKWRYRRQAVEDIHEAVRKMLLDRIQASADNGGG